MISGESAEDTGSDYGYVVGHALTIIGHDEHR
jgi:hypothetical protein